MMIFLFHPNHALLKQIPYMITDKVENRVIDLLYRDNNGWHIIDFKTDRVTLETAEARAQSYRGQVELYSQALTALTGTPVVHKVLWFFALGRGFEV